MKAKRATATQFSAALLIRAQKVLRNAKLTAPAMKPPHARLTATAAATAETTAAAAPQEIALRS